MIIDSHAHVSRADWSSPKFLEEVIEPAMRASGAEIPSTVYEGTDIPAMMESYRAAGVDKVFLYAVAPREPKTFGRDPATREIAGAHVSNDYIADVCSQYPDLTVPVMAVNPRYEGDTVLGEMERCVREFGAKAVKLYPTYNHYRPDDREWCWPIYRKAMELEIPVIVHQSWTTLVDAPMKYQYPGQLDDVAREFRDLVLICCHFGVPWIEEAMALVAKHTNVYVDTSYWATIEEPEIVLRHLLRCQRYGCTYDRILWGTDFPVTPPAPSLEIFRETLPALAAKLGLDPIPKEGLDLMLGGNAARIYGLE
jgi:uncharacterized protein